MPDIHTFEPLWGEWYIVKRLGQGSFGTVYLAEKSELGKKYYSAIKHIKIPVNDESGDGLYSENDETRRQYYDSMFNTLMREIDINFQLKGNTNIVSYEEHKVFPRENKLGYDVFIKMELLTSLTDRIQNAPFTVGDVVRLGKDMCTALTVLQQNRIVHRDIKPQNIFVHSGGHYKLGDFGVARTLEKTASHMTVAGAIAYMSPEVRRGGEGDYRVDVYSLGLVLYRLLNGNRSPFLPMPPASITYDSDMQAHTRRLHGEKLPPPPMADERLSAIILKACAYRPEDRYPDAAHFRSALAEYEASAPPGLLMTVVLGNQLPFFPPPPPPPPPPLPKPEEKWKRKDQSHHRRKNLTGSHNNSGGSDVTEVLNPHPKSKAKRFFIIGAAVAAAVFLVIVLLPKNFGAANTPSPKSSAVTESSSAVTPPKDSHPAATSSNAAVILADEGLEACIRELLGLGMEDEITYRLLEQIDGLPAGTDKGYTVRTLEDLILLPNLRALDISGQQPDSFDPITKLDSLTELVLNGCDLGQNEVLDSLPSGIQHLSLNYTGLNSLEFASRLEQLRRLNIRGNSITDLGPLASLTRLRYLDAGENNISDWSPVERIRDVDGRPDPDDPIISVSSSPSPTPSASPTPRPTNTPRPPTPTQPSEPAQVSGISVFPGSAVLEVGEVLTLTATVSPAGAANVSVSWSSSNPGVATVDGSGRVTAKGSGSTVITASCGGYTASCSVSVG